MRTTVGRCPHRKTWDATVRVTGGHPQQLWGVGEAQAATEGPGLRVERVLVHDAGQRTLGYAQLYLRSEAERVIAGTVQCHVHRPDDLPVVGQALADWVREEHAAAVLRLDADTLRTPGVGEALARVGFARRAAVVAGPRGPRRLQVLLGSTGEDLSRRLSEATLRRCRAALRTPGVTVREVGAGSPALARIGLRAGLIERLLEDLGGNSLLLVATEGADGAETALGYLWFVHTGTLAMIYRLGFTRRGRELGIDDALLLTGLAELQKRRVRQLDGGDPAEPDVPLVVRELADAERSVLGTWEKVLGPAGELAGTADASDAAEERSTTAVAAALGLADRVPAQPPRPAVPAAVPAAGEEPGRGGGAERWRTFPRRVLSEGLSALRDAAGR